MNVLSRPAFSTSALPLRSSPSLLLVLLLFLCAQCTTSRTASAPGCYKARLEVKGMCSNYTIKILEGPVDTGKVAASWTDENTNKSYTNVFALDNACAFPDSLNAGDEFYFTIDTSAKQECNVCMAYYPVPPKRLAIKVLPSPCP